jgi:hypothetical protein
MEKFTFRLVRFTVLKGALLKDPNAGKPVMGGSCARSLPAGISSRTARSVAPPQRVLGRSKPHSRQNLSTATLYADTPSFVGFIVFLLRED